LHIAYRYKRLAIGFSVFVLMVLIGAVGPIIYRSDPLSSDNPKKMPPSPKYPFGTDTYGRDLTSQFVNGMRSSLYVGLLTCLIALSIGTLIRVVAGVKGGILDEVLMAITNIVLSIPSILFAILLASYFQVRSIELIALLIGITDWPWYARAIRAQLMSLREREFVYLSKLAGYNDMRIAVEDLLPNVATYIFLASVLFIIDGILGEAALSIIGLGPTRQITLGMMLWWAASMEAFRRELWWWFVPPGIAIIAIATSLLLIATAVDEIFNPRLRRG
jgi:peptide/nickel transport system permease protein